MNTFLNNREGDLRSDLPRIGRGTPISRGSQQETQDGGGRVVEDRNGLVETVATGILLIILTMMIYMMNDTTFTKSQHDGSTFDACVVIYSVAATLWIANLLCDKWLPSNRYDDDGDFEELRNSLDHVEDDQEGDQEEQEHDDDDHVEGGQVAEFVEDDLEDNEEDNDDDDDYEEGQVFDRYEKILPQKLEQSIVPCMQNRVRFADVVMVREYELPESRTMAHIDSQTNQNSRNKCPSRERLDSVMRFHLRTAHEVEPMDIDGSEDLVQGPAQLRKRCTPTVDARSNKRRRIGELEEDTAASGAPKRLAPSAPSGADARPDKRIKMTIPSSTKEWARNINMLHTPPMPVLIEGREIDEDSRISSSSRSGDNFDGLTEDDDDDDDLSLGSTFDLEADGFSDENETYQPLDHSPIAESDDDSIDENNVSHQDIAMDQAESSIEPNSDSSIELGSGWTESGKRFSLRLAKRVADEDSSLGSGMTRDGQRFSRRVASRQRSSTS